MFLLGVDVGTGSLVKFVSVDTCSYIIIVFFHLHTTLVLYCLHTCIVMSFVQGEVIITTHVYSYEVSKTHH